MAIYDLEITSDGKLRSFPQTAPGDLQMDLEIVAGRSPISLVVSLSDYRRLSKLFNHPKCLMSEDARIAIETALEAGKKVARPITKPTDFELTAYVEEVKKLKCIKNVHIEGDDKFSGLELTKGKEYEFVSKKIEFVEPFTKEKYLFDESTEQIGTRTHQMSFKGNDYALQFVDDRGWTMRFRDHPTIHTDINEAKIWEYFERPDVPTVASDNMDKYNEGLDVLRYMEHSAQPKFAFYPGQMKYIASASCSDSALIAAETGCGKTLIAISLVMMKAPGRALICAPKGTVASKDAKVHAQWVKEFRKFAPDVPVYKLFTPGDYEKLKNENGGELPYGVFLTYDHAMFRGGMEHIPDSWMQKKKDPETGKDITPDPEAKYREHLEQRKVKIPPLFDGIGTRDRNNYHFGIGEQRTMPVLNKGAITGEKVCIRCVSEPCMATEIGLEMWDMVILDEAHAICNLDAQMTKNFIRLQAKYRFALTATPIPNMIWNIFSLMGWLSVPHWYFGDRSNAAWPYKLDEMTGRGGFIDEFVTKEIDHTQAKMNQKAGRGPAAVKRSPKISQQAKLLKLIRPMVAFIPKDRCNPNLPKLNVLKISVPMSKEQRQNYSHYMNPAHVKTKNKMTRYGTQLAYLRGIGNNPKSCGKNRTEGSYNIYSSTDYTPKTHAALENVFNILSKGEQVLIAGAAIDQLNEMQRRLAEAKIKYTVINGDNSDKAGAAEKFKSGEVPVLFMSNKCAQALSFEQCSNMIIMSLDWAFGVFDQTVGRCYRVNSPKDVNCYIYLHSESLDELMFDKLCSKQDAATIALHGEKVDNEVITVDKQSILGEHMLQWQTLRGQIDLSEESEAELLAKWPKLLDKLKTITAGEELGITKEDQDAVAELLEEMEDYA